MQFFAYPVLPQVASNEIFLDKVPHDKSYLCVKYLTVADGGSGLPMLYKNQKF